MSTVSKFFSIFSQSHVWIPHRPPPKTIPYLKPLLPNVLGPLSGVPLSYHLLSCSIIKDELGPPSSAIPILELFQRLEGSIWETSERCGEAHMGFPERVKNATLN